MGTVFSIDVRAPGCPPAAVADAVGWLHWVDATFSTYQPQSQLSRLARGELSPTECAPEMTEILTRCAELEHEADGYFSAYATGQLDPSGLVKGWAIQRVSDRLRAAGSRNHCVNGGGDVQCVGQAAPNRPWRVGIADPHQPGQILGTVVADQGVDGLSPALAVATSGSAERGAHITDPRTRLAATALASVTLIGRDLGTTDAYATAAFAMGERAPAWIEARPGHRGLVVFADGRRWVSPALTPDGPDRDGAGNRAALGRTTLPA